jgi:RNA polymerase sigma-70 factor (ECF subfamily)
LAPYIPNTEEELISMLQGRDEQAFGYLYDNYSGALYGVILKMLGSEEGSRDLLQEVFVKIWRNIGSYDSAKGRLYTWMLNIARNAAIDILRSPGYTREKITTDLANDAHMERITPAAMLKTDHVGLQKVVAGLKEEYRKIIDLAYFKGYTQEEIAEELNIPVGTVKTRSRSALLQLKSLIR